MTTVLQQLLEAGLVEIDDDDQIEKLLAAADSVQKQLSEGKLSVSAATLVAMDPGINPDEPVLVSVYKIVADHWRTVKTRHPNTPVALLRGVLTQALVKAGEANPIATIIWLTAKSYAPYAPLAREEEVWKALLLVIGERAEQAGAEFWSGRGDELDVKIPVPELPSPTINASTVDPSSLAPYLAAAAGQISNPPEGITANAQQVIPNYGTASHIWATTFGKSAAVAISEAINLTLNELSRNVDLGPLTEALREYATRIGTAVSSALAPLHAIERRSQVLFWREALYSKSQRQPYRALSATSAMVAMATDLAAEVPAMCPASIDSLLREASHSITDQETTIGDFVETLTTMQGPDFSDLTRENVHTSGRKTLLAFVREALTTRQVAEDIRAQLGVEPGKEIPLPDFSCWLFRDLCAEKLEAGIGSRLQRRRK